MMFFFESNTKIEQQTEFLNSANADFFLDWPCGLGNNERSVKCGSWC